MSHTFKAMDVLCVLGRLGAVLLAETVIVNKFTVSIQSIICQLGEFVLLGLSNAAKSL